MRCKESHLFHKVQKMSWKPHEAQKPDFGSQEIILLLIIGIVYKDIRRKWNNQRYALEWCTKLDHQIDLYLSSRY